MDIVIVFNRFFPFLLSPQGLSLVRRSVLCKTIKVPLLAIMCPGPSPECGQIKPLRPPGKLLRYGRFPPMNACKTVN
jgi:hypothetical protein